MVAQLPSGGIPEIGLKVQLVRFFEGPDNPIATQENRNYDELFFYNAARYIFWELTLNYPKTSRDIPITVKAAWQGPGVSYIDEHQAPTASGDGLVPDRMRQASELLAFGEYR